LRWPPERRPHGLAIAAAKVIKTAVAMISSLTWMSGTDDASGESAAITQRTALTTTKAPSR
jgi:hypothetical protein